jgi:hypothetical protein
MTVEAEIVTAVVVAAAAGCSETVTAESVAAVAGIVVVAVVATVTVVAKAVEWRLLNMTVER